MLEYFNKKVRFILLIGSLIHQRKEQITLQGAGVIPVYPQKQDKNQKLRNIDSQRKHEAAYFKVSPNIIGTSIFHLLKLTE